MTYNLFLDDVREPMCLNDNREWVVIKSYEKFIAKITKDGLPELISFDHDLATKQYPLNAREMYDTIDYNNPRYVEKTGYHCALWLINHCRENKLPLPKWQVHSLNPVGKWNIYQVLARYEETQNL